MNRAASVLLVAGTTSLAPMSAAPVVSAELLQLEANPTGLAAGFWTNYRMSADIVRDFGPRPLERVNFHKWLQHEKQPGTIDFTDAFRWEEWGHLAGSTVITNVNTFFTRQLNPNGMECIPESYAQDIDDPETRAAARLYLRAFVRELLKTTGTAWLALDYEMFWFALPTTPGIRESYRTWFLESAALCREVAAEMGLADRLKIGFIANTDPYDTAGHSIGSPAGPGHEPQSWVLDCIAAADFVGLDTYAGGADRSKTPEKQLRAMRFWLEHYVGDKPFYITESGFTTSVEEGDDRQGYHIRGTETEQAAFFTAMFQALTSAREDASDPLSKVRGYLIWQYADRGDQEDLVEKHLGLIRLDGTRKPAHGAVAAELARIDADAALSAWKIVRSRAISGGEPFDIFRDGGSRFDAVDLTIRPESDSPHVLVVDSDHPVCLIVRVGARTWLTTHPEASTTSAIELPSLPAGEEVSLQVQFTAAKYPLQTRITSLRLGPAQP